MAIDLSPQLRRFAPLPRVAAGPDRASDPRYQQTRQRRLAVLLLLLVLVCTVIFLVRPSHMLSAPLVPIVVAAGLFLQSVPMYAVFAAAGASLLVTSLHASAPPVTASAVGVVMLLMVAVERRRMRTGISGEVGADLVLELSGRLSEQSRLADPLPAGWHLDSSVQAAHGQPLSGDTVLTHRAGDLLEVALIDIEGHGLQCGSRSLMLSSAFSGMLGAVAPADFLPAANRYLMRQQWCDGFATAVHLTIDLRTGDYCLRSAGHPAAIQYSAGTGRWQPRADARGVMLGVLDSDLISYDAAEGRLCPGDTLLLYSDGVIESPECDLQQGLDRMLGAADRVVTAQPQAGAAALICAAARAGEADDRSAVLIRRD